jgi:hypothetical protein
MNIEYSDIDEEMESPGNEQIHGKIKAALQNLLRLGSLYQ